MTELYGGLGSLALAEHKLRSVAQGKNHFGSRASQARSTLAGKLQKCCASSVLMIQLCERLELSEGDCIVG